MADPITILGIAGSLRKDSYNKGALRAAQQLCPQGAKLELYDIAGLPLFNQDYEQKPTAKVTEFKQRIRAADAILISTAEYNYGLPGVLKNAIDVASRPYGDNAWSGKPIALMSAAMGVAGGIRAQYQLRQCFVFLNLDAVVQPEVAIGNAPQRFDAAGNLTDETSKKMIAQLLQNLVYKVRLMRQPMKAAA
ncbi:MAG: NAD(P)H-dependent oxidoreductase [Betaproteobacteria bacterium]|nr:NAD(P)H-dependent oxidoreductase [Betaproteobacteria bacterium]MBV9360748.1 NAD(P)H-dependent oxidoreductase [Betaproteobacteria bacterium]